MAKLKVLIEVGGSRAEGFQSFEAAADSEDAAVSASVDALEVVAGLGVEIDEPLVPVPMFTPARRRASGASPAPEAFSEFASADTNSDMSAQSVVVPAEVDRSQLEELRTRNRITVWANSPVELFDQDEADVIDLARSRPGLDCRPFRGAVSIATIRAMLGVSSAWSDGFRGQNIAVGILDEGVNGETYPVVGGFARPNALQPGAAEITSHGSMCAADVLVAAPAARIYDYPFLGIANSGGVLTMFQAVLDQRRVDGSPHLTSNSYGFVGVPPVGGAPTHEIHDLNHPVHRKVREVIASGAACFFAAGNCGEDCPSASCHPSGIGPGRSIHASNSLAEVITVAAVNTRHERVGYSSQGPGMFEPKKPDLACYSHFFGNFGPGRPAGGPATSFDNGTSAATPVAAGVGALLLSANPQMSPEDLRTVLMKGLVNVTGSGWHPGYGHGIMNAGVSYTLARQQLL